jgi:hypothetical protein
MANVSATAFASPRDSAPNPIRVGDVLIRSQKMFAAHWLAYSMTVLLGYLPVIVLSLGFGASVAAGGALSGRIIVVLVVGGIASLVCLMLAHAAIYVGVWQDARGRGFAFGQALSAALRQAPAFIGLLLLIWMFATFAAFLLLIPALIVICVYLVAFPACVVEGLGPLKSMSRSAFLTKGNRWRIFGLLAVLYFGATAASQLFITAAKLIGGATFSLIVALPVEGIVGGFSAVTISVLYLQLRIAREGVDVDQITKVFD